MTMRHLYQKTEESDTAVEFEISSALNALGEYQGGFLRELAQDKPTKEALSQYGLALLIEVAEFTNELPWKLWKPGMEIDRDRVTDEFADILAFIGTWVHYLRELGITEDDLANAYIKKRRKNVERFEGKSGEAGYTGVKS